MRCLATVQEGSSGSSEDEEGSEDGGEEPRGGRKAGGGGAVKKAAAALSVGVGHFTDPWNLQGLSHYLEHMLFMGSERYPDENDYDAFLTAHGGASNACTEEVRPAGGVALGGGWGAAGGAAGLNARAIGTCRRQQAAGQGAGAGAVHPSCRCTTCSTTTTSDQPLNCRPAPSRPFHPCRRAPPSTLM